MPPVSRFNHAALMGSRIVDDVQRQSRELLRSAQRSPRYQRAFTMNTRS